MKSMAKRLQELKNELDPYLQSRMIFLLNPKDIKALEAVVAWTAIPKPDISAIFVQDDDNMEELWRAVPPNIMRFAVALGVKMQDAIPRLAQLQELNLIYPDGSVASLAMTIVNVYIKGQVTKIQPKEEKGHKSETLKEKSESSDK